MAKKSNAAPKIHPNAKHFTELMKGRPFKRADAEETWECEGCIAKFPDPENDDNNDWKVSVDGGNTWHDGRYPSGVNLLRNTLDSKLNAQNSKA